ncbi:RagB/SusD family nutrient uptake outer membrane protein [uncultured Bacteroides sp.]|uniref:RagB/SusD family nutrient uptake outer membrane protein n=1 Tax=uncultured Bacteroides sp. TaxID=162156 RepID=UPI0025CF3C73|nr:RagB/SusD family nutrient uptake outer membrane protein [uncultured Bacteroides sp.]
MKKLTIKKIALSAILPLGIFASCDYLDVVPPEQPEFKDTMTDATDAVNFINSCYIAVESCAPFVYSTYEWSTDESVDPPLWNGNNQRTAWNLWSPTNAAGYWDGYYNYNGHCHMFLDILADNDPRGATEADKARWRSEAEFLKAYYHSRLLAMYGPVPIVDQRLPQSTMPEDMPGRSHYDYVVDYIVNKLDEAAPNLPATGQADDWGRATSTAAKAIKGRVLLYAASDLWNGKFPYPDWKNTNYETPGYGKELVSHTYDPQKWQRALDANLDALQYAEKEGGRSLVDMNNLPRTLADLPVPYIPGVDTTTVEGKEFAKRVLMLRSITNSDENDGNKEIIWGVFMQGDRQWINFATWPKRIVQYNNNWVDGWCAISPTLYSAEHYYTVNGKLPEKDGEFAPKNEWFTSANINDRSEVIKLHVNREPRFYASLSFDGDDYSSIMCDGKPLRINLRDANKQGYNHDLFYRDYTVTGYISKKYTSPEIRISSVTGTDNRKNYAKPLFRLAELYLNVAECYAALGDNKNAIKYLNPIRKRAGIPELEETDITSGMTMMDWVRNERFVELWGEGHRFYDVRRWMTAPQTLRAGAREGLNVLGAGMNPSFNELNKRTVINQQFQWHNHMYLWPIKASEIYNNPQLVQAPEY